MTMKDATDSPSLRCTRRAFCALAGTGALALAAALAGCDGQDATDAAPQDGEEAQTAVDDASRAVEKAATDGTALRDRDAVYAEDDETSVVCMYLTVRRGNSGENTDHSWTDINANSKYWYEQQGLEQYCCEAILQVGDEVGPLPEQLGYTALAANATVKIRGQSSSYSAQKNYKVDLMKDRGTWRDQRVINLNKHMSEGMRFRNKLAYDLLKSIPQTTACRTQFVHLYVKDETDSPAQTAFEDYGLYTQVEQLNKTYLKNHGLDNYGQLYKVEYFEFYRYPEAIKLKDDPDFSQEAFDEVLEVKGDSDHSKLIAMLDAVNDYTIPIEETLAGWFDVENLVYWMAFHMLMGNIDVQTRNAFLYSPQNVERFYVLSWDNDGCLLKKEYEVLGSNSALGWQRGVSNYWGQVLYCRALKLPEFRARLDEAVEDLVANYLTEERLTSMVADYRSVVEPFVYFQPDLLHAPLTSAEYDEVAQALPREVQENLASYRESLEKPMPFYIGTPTVEGGRLQMTWDASYDFDSEPVTYSAVLARDADFEQVVDYGKGLTIPAMTSDYTKEGQYFLKVESTNESGHTQVAFDIYTRTDTGEKMYGTICFYILADGSVVRSDGTQDEGDAASSGQDGAGDEGAGA